MAREKIEPIPRHYRTITKPAPGGGYETALLQIFHDDFQVIGEWLHPERELPVEVKRQIRTIKTAPDATRANPSNKY